MIDFHTNPVPDYRPYLKRGREERAAQFRSFGRGLVSALGRLFTRLQRANQARRARADLRALDDRMLRDMGIARSEIAYRVDAALAGEAAPAGPVERQGATQTEDFASYRHRSAMTQASQSGRRALQT